MESKGRGTLPLGQKTAYIVSNVGTAFSWGYITSYFMMFCTDAVGIPMVICSVLLLASRLVDGVTDTLFGYIADKRVGRLGRYRGWVLIFALPVAIFAAMLFYNDTGWPLNLRVLWTSAAYFLFLLAFTGLNIPLDAMASVLSGSPRVRANVVSLKSAMEIVGAMLMTHIATLYFNEHGTDTVAPYFNLALIFGAIAVPLYLLAPIFCRERIVPELGEKKPRVWAAMRESLRSKPFRIAFVGHFLNGLISYGRVAVFIYYFKYVAGDLSLYATFILLMRVPQICGAYAAQYALRLFKKPGPALCAIYALYGFSLIANFFVLPAGDTLMLFWVLTAVSSFLFGISYSLINIITPDLVDYSEYCYGSRNDGGISAFLAFGNKVGMAAGTFGMGIVLETVGYTANAAQSEATIAGISHLMFTIPGALAIVIGVLFIFYRLSSTTLHSGD